MRGGKPPIPSSVTATGMCARSANARSASSAPEIMHAVAGEDHGPLALRSISAAARASVGPGGRGLAPAAAHRRRRVPVELAGGLLRVFRDVDQHRAGTALLRDLERLAHRRRDILGARDEVVVFRHRQRDAGDVDLLERVGADQAAADLAGDADDRRRVEHRGGDAGDHVGRARTGGGDRDADAPGRPRIAVGHVRGALLVPHQRVPDRVVEHRVIGGEDRAAGIPEDLGDPSRTRHSQRICAPVSFIARSSCIANSLAGFRLQP